MVSRVHTSAWFLVWTLVPTLEATRGASETPGRRPLATRDVPTPPVSHAGTRANASTAPHTNHLAPHQRLKKRSVDIEVFDFRQVSISACKLRENKKIGPPELLHVGLHDLASRSQAYPSASRARGKKVFDLSITQERFGSSSHPGLRPVHDPRPFWEQ
jgi:hypothetical protein